MSGRREVMLKLKIGILAVVAALSFVAIKSIVSSTSSTAASFAPDPIRPLNLMIESPSYLPVVQADLS
jgi:hypothetical protein